MHADANKCIPLQKGRSLGIKERNVRALEFLRIHNYEQNTIKLSTHHSFIGVRMNWLHRGQKLETVWVVPSWISLMSSLEWSSYVPWLTIWHKNVEEINQFSKVVADKNEGALLSELTVDPNEAMGIIRVLQRFGLVLVITLYRCQLRWPFCNGPYRKNTTNCLCERFVPTVITLFLHFLFIKCISS